MPQTWQRYWSNGWAVKPSSDWRINHRSRSATPYIPGKSGYRHSGAVVSFHEDPRSEECLAFPPVAESQLRDSTGIAPVSSDQIASGQPERSDGYIESGRKKIETNAPRSAVCSGGLPRSFAGKKGDVIADLGNAGLGNLRFQHILVMAA
jgi:hypothetical protein